MGQISVKLNDRIYRLACDDGDEQRLVELAEYVKAKVTRLTSEFGRVGDDRLMLMTALIIADELWDLRANQDASSDSATASASARSPAHVDQQRSRRLKAIAAGIPVETAASATEPENLV